MKTTISGTTKDIIREFDEQLYDILMEDVRNYRKMHHDNLINFNTRIFDLELQRILQEELKTVNQNRRELANVG